ncbi:MAG: hypothetical protein ABL888_13595 [Pirellulaceae bacterium]
MSSNQQHEINDASKQELLEQLQRELTTWRQRRRIVRKTTLSLGLLLVVGIGIVAGLRLTRAPQADPAALDRDPTLAIESKPETPVDKIAANPSTPNETSQFSAIKVERIDDSTLLSILNDLGQPSFFATVDGKKRLIREKM